MISATLSTIGIYRRINMNELKPIDNQGKKEFEKTIKNLNELTRRNQEAHSMSRVKERGGLFNLFPTIITGAQMNNFACEVQSCFADVNNKINECYKQFIEVYNAFNTLDKEYISGIVGAFNQAIEATNKAELAQQDIEKTIVNLEKTVEKFGEFIKKVNSELSRIDPDNWKENALKHQKELDEIDRKANEIIATVNSYKEQHNDLENQLMQYKKEKQRNTIGFRICWITTSAAILTMIVLVLLIVFKVI